MKKKLDSRENAENSPANTENKVMALPVERRIWDWLNKHSRCIAVIAVSLLVVGTIYLLVCAWNRHTIRNHLEAYSTKNSLQERLTWAETKQPNALKNLQGFVFLENAYSFTENNDFTKAIIYFNKAITCLQISPLKEQALAGVAYAYLQTSQRNMAKKMFWELYKCKSKYLRAQALFVLCSIAMQEGDNAKFDEYKKRLQEYDEGIEFLQKLEIFESVK